ncbi:protein FAM171B-like [Brachyistius frenatus]|uniref:protein FAM171B-like n=1 Tax=Brachyistius frenatus TaxID=100188 RepID=UPI0037E8FBB1
MRRPCVCLLGALVLVLVFSENGEASGEFGPTAGRPLHIDDGNFSDRDRTKQAAIQQQQQQQQQQVLEPLPGPSFDLKVQVSDALSRQYLSQAVVEVYVNYTGTNAAVTGEDGGASLRVPYQPGLPIAVVASKEGYVSSPLPYKTDKMPIFSSVIVSLLRLNQGNIWLFEDSVLITGKTSDASSQPVIRFPKSLLNLTHGSDVTSVKAYLTIPKLTSQQDGFLKTRGIMSSKSGYVSVELSPVAAVSVQLFSGDTELHVSGPVQISLSVPDSCGLQTSDVVPAWFFNRTTGGWMRKGLGKVMSVDGKLLWTFTAPHLGYWIAAPLSSTRGFFGFAVAVDFLLRHSSLLMVFCGGALVIVICLLVGVLYYCRSVRGENKARKRRRVMKKDQTTSTCDNEVFEVLTGNAFHPHDGPNQSFTERDANQHNASYITMHGDNIIANPSAAAIALECDDLDLNTDLNDLETSEQIRVPPSLTDSLFFYNRPVAILHAPAFFHLGERPEPTEWSRSATLPRAGASNGADTEPLSEEGFAQTKGPFATQNPAGETEGRLGVSEGSRAATSTGTSRGPFPESLSVPGTLNKIGNRRLMHALKGLSTIPSPQPPPRAWFVSLEGKPAAEIHYAVSEQQRRRRPVESRETSLDSGVDMSELNQTSVRRTVTLERNATFVKSTTGGKQAPLQ